MKHHGRLNADHEGAGQLHATHSRQGECISQSFPSGSDGMSERSYKEGTGCTAPAVGFISEYLQGRFTFLSRPSEALYLLCV